MATDFVEKKFTAAEVAALLTSAEDMGGGLINIFGNDVAQVLITEGASTDTIRAHYRKVMQALSEGFLDLRAPNVQKTVFVNLVRRMVQAGTSSVTEMDKETKRILTRCYFTSTYAASLLKSMHFDRMAQSQYVYMVRDAA